MHGQVLGIEGVILEVLRGLDVILVLIGPIQLHFLALVRQGVDSLFVTALGDEVALIVIAVEEGIERRVDVRLQPCHISGGGGERSQLFGNQFGQAAMEESRDFLALDVQDAIDAKIQVALVNLEDFFEQLDESLLPVVHNLYRVDQPTINTLSVEDD
jgi:hypothetical protein